MSKSNSKKIFISYGHVDATDLAVRLKRDLEEKGHDVWLDISRMRDADPWEDQIEVEILNSDVFIALLSPHAVRRPDGVCLDEISLARYKHRKIIPVMVLKCQPPLGIFRLNWIDFQNWENESQYQKLFERLLKAIDTEVVVEGIYASIFSEIKQIDFGSEIFDLIRDFTGRDWLFRELDDWLKNEESRVFLITGDPGIGKSAIMAYLVHNHPQVVACHFCDSEIKDSLDANLFIKSIAAQLATQLDNYRGALEGVDIEELIGFGDPGTLMRRLIIDPLKAERRDKPMIIIIDALDEILTDPSSGIIKILRNQLKHLPTWIRLVFSSRKEPKIVDSLSKFKPHEIEASRPENLQDIKIYLDQQLGMAEISEKLTEKGVSKEFVADVIYKKSEGNFLYVKEAIEAIREGSIDPSHPESYPDALIGFYMSYFEQKFPNGQGYEEIRKILDIILTARELLTAEQIAYFIDLDSFEIEQKLQQLAVYFPKRVNHYKVYHKALIDWLLGLIGSDTTYRVNIERSHRTISEKLYQSYEDGKIPSFLNKYLLRRLPQHLSEIKDWDKTVKILSALQYIELCAQNRVISNLIKNYLDVLASFDLPDEDRKKLEEYKQFVLNQAHVLRKCPQAISQQAINQPDSSILSLAGREYLKSVKSPTPWFEWKNKPQVYDPSILTLDGHSLSVEGCAFSPDGTKILSASGDGTLKLWDVETGAEIRTFTGHSGPVQGCAFSPDGTKIISASDDTNLKLWDTKTGVEIKTFTGHSKEVWECAFSPDGTKILSASWDGTLKLWDVETGAEIRTFTGHSGWVWGCAFSPDGTNILSASIDNTLKLWRSETGVEIRTFTGHSYEVKGCAFSPDGTKILSASLDKTLKLWDAETGVEIRTFTGHSYGVNECLFSPDGNKILSASQDRTLKLWDAKTGAMIRTFTGHSYSVEGCGFSPDGTKILSASSDKTLKLWDVEIGVEIGIFPGHSYEVNECLFSPDGAKILSASQDMTLKLWDAETGAEIRTFTGRPNWVSKCAFSPDGTKIISVSNAKTLKLWDVKNRAEIRTFTGHSSLILGCVFSPDGTKILSASLDKTLKLWDAETGVDIRTFTGHSYSVNGCAFSPDGTKILSASLDRTLKLWDAETGVEIRTFTGHSYSVYECLFSPDGNKILSASGDMTLKLWDAETGAIIRTFTGDSSGVNECAFSPDGTKILSASRDKTLKLWDTETGAEIITFRTIGEATTISINSRNLVAAGDNTGRLYILQLHNI